MCLDIQGLTLWKSHWKVKKLVTEIMRITWLNGSMAIQPHCQRKRKRGWRLQRELVTRKSGILNRIKIPASNECALAVNLLHLSDFYFWILFSCRNLIVKNKLVIMHTVAATYMLAFKRVLLAQPMWRSAQDLVFWCLQFVRLQCVFSDQIQLIVHLCVACVRHLTNLFWQLQLEMVRIPPSHIFDSRIRSSGHI